jgi:beta-N-acetylhexosaminidase
MKDVFINTMRFVVSLSLLAALCLPVQSSQANSNQDTSTTEAKAKALLAKMTPEEKVGQLFVVTFNGVDVSNETQIYDLITNHDIGGVVLRADHDNFTGPDNTIASARTLINQLQTIESDAAQNNKNQSRTYIPLIIGLSQAGDGSPTDQILSGMTSLPSEMMIGATWNTQLAKAVGEALGTDLSQLGVNLYIGPSLDVLESSWKEGADDLGIQSFGGDPYWVGVMGQAFISGLHTGSNQKVLVISKHFPGRGAADRPLDTEVATVRKSLEQLKQIELAPFFAATNSLDPTALTDGLLVSHIRYQGFQGNIRATTKPVSLDSAALEQILALPEFAAWRANGGIMMSDNLGSQAVRRFTDSTLQTFDSRQVARAAFLAGNDLLYVDNFAGTGDADSYTGIVNTLDFFVQKYNQDAAFATRVDQSVLRILNMKYKIYPSFSLSQIIPQASGLDTIGEQKGLDYTIAQNAATLIDPSSSELASILPDPPSRSDRIVFLTDTLKVHQCSTCNEQTVPAVDGLQKAVLASYGPQSANLTVSSRLSSYSFQSILDWMNNINPPANFETDMHQANWIVVSTLNLDQARPASYAFKRLLSEKPELFRNKKVVVFSLNAPYYLDATDISKTTAYYGIYGKTQACLNLAALILFQELTPKGASPVSIPGVGYDLIQATSPDPAQVISLMLDLPENPAVTPSAKPVSSLTPSPMPEYKIGDTLPVRTGIITDHNGNPVPDGTVARFVISTGTEGNATQQIDATTVSGVARTSFRITNKGLMQIHVISEPALTSSILQLDVPSDAGAVVIAVAPTNLPTYTPFPTQTTAPTPSATPVPVEQSNETKPVFWAWVLSILIIGLGAGMVFNLGLRMHSSRWGVRWALCTALGGLASYIYLASGLPGGKSWMKLTGVTGLIGIVFVFMIFGWTVGILWYSFNRKDPHIY